MSNTILTLEEINQELDKNPRLSREQLLLRIKELEYEKITKAVSHDNFGYYYAPETD